MLEALKDEMKLSFGTHKLAIEDAKDLLENNGWVATK
ncbi:hypothetical protein IMAU30049_00067 [Lactobacillus helveticus]|nr:hypothetical protein [Lactobacillus helveticus]NRO69429.1 hypothetical protein [Lactobacillus helveticus]NRO74062.1 hypothetical protein [Lactobacillus helveticus]